MVEEYHASCVNDFWVHMAEGVFTELYDLCRLLLVANEFHSSVGLVHVSNHFQGNEMIVTHYLVRCIFNVYAKQILEYGQIKGFPMLVVNVSCWSLIRKQQTNQIHQSNFRFVLSDLEHFDKLIYGFLRNTLEVEYI